MIEFNETNFMDLINKLQEFEDELEKRDTQFFGSKLNFELNFPVLIVNCF